jgi:hypothetical protein
VETATAPYSGFAMSGRKAVEIKRFGLTQVYAPEDESKSIAMYALPLPPWLIWH